MPWWNPTNDPEWSEKFRNRLEKSLQELKEQLREIKIRPANTSRESFTPCIGYWQPQGEDADRRMMSTTEDENGL